MNNYFETNNKSDCNGCGACALRCPVKAITMKEDSEGFLYPVIDESKCIHCGLCRKICSNNPQELNIQEESYIAINNNKDELKVSSSGGMFSILARYILKKKGIVFGVEYDSNLKVIHNYIDSVDNLEKFRYSKYVRSDLKDSFQKVEEFLKEDKYVLFTGTPCQCAGLRSYLMREYDKLITCELICHANASPKIFELFKENIINTNNKNIKSINFRNKSKYGWHSGTYMTVRFEDGVEINESAYTNAFQSELINRPCCYSCRFCTTERFSDFTIGDFWGIEKIDPLIKDDNTGISLLNVNTDKGRKIFEEIKDEMFTKEVDTDLAFSNNHHSNVPVNKNRDKFFKGLEVGIINETNIIYYLNKYTKRPLYRRMLSKFKGIVKKMLRR